MPDPVLRINSRIARLVGSATLAITARAKELRAQGEDVVNFAGGEPDFDTPDEIKEAAVAAIRAGRTKYTPSIGTLELRRAVCAKLARDNGLEYSPEEIAVSCGAKHALFNAIQVLVDVGDEVLIPAPYWVSYPEMVKCAGAVPRILPTDSKTHFKITPEQVADAADGKTRILILNSPSNPTGAVYDRKELEGIAAVCVRRGIRIISDEIYERLVYDIPEYVSLASLGPEVRDRTVTINGVSKAYAMTGWRIGYCAASKEIIGWIKKLQDHSTSNPCAVSQAAAVKALEMGTEEAEAMRAEFAARRDVMLKGLAAIPRMRAFTPQGAFYVFVDVSAFGDAASTAAAILDEAKVALIPGEGFGAPGFVRMSFATSRAQIREGVRRIASWAARRSP